MDLYSPLKKFFGFNKFKGLQEQVIKSIVENNNTFVIMPTGGGKSLCYQLPALMSEGTAIVVSPLIALMKNQVDAIRGISEHNGVAHVLNSSLNKTEIAQVKEDITNGITKLLYVAPESLIKEEYVAFLNSDDCYASTDILDQVLEKMSNDKLDVLFCGIELFDEKDKKVRKWVMSHSKTLQQMGIIQAPHPGMFMRTDVFKRLNYRFSTCYKKGK